MNSWHPHCRRPAAWLVPIVAFGFLVALRSTEVPAIAAEPDEPAGRPPAAAPDSDEPDEPSPSRRSTTAQSFFQGYRLKAGQEADHVVVIFGDAVVDGKVREDVVNLFGRLTVNGEIGGDVVDVFGSIRMNGRTRGNLVNVLGRTRVNGRVEHNAVNVGMGLVLGPTARVDGDAVGILGGVDADDGAKIGGEMVPVDLGFGHLPDWVWPLGRECLFKMRTLSLKAPASLFISVILLAIYLGAGFVAPGAVRAVAFSIQTRPVVTALLGLLALPLTLLLSVFLLGIVVGIPVIPFLAAALLALALVGKAGLFAAVGQSIARKSTGAIALSTLAGWFLISLLYFVPVIGMTTWAVTGLWALGGGLQAIFDRRRREDQTKVERPNPVAFPARASQQPAAVTATAAAAARAATIALATHPQAGPAGPASNPMISSEPNPSRPSPTPPAITTPGTPAPETLAPTSASTPTTPDPGGGAPAPEISSAAPNTPEAPTTAPVPSPEAPAAAAPSSPATTAPLSVPPPPYGSARTVARQAGPNPGVSSRPGRLPIADQLGLPRVGFGVRLWVAAADWIVAAILIHLLLPFNDVPNSVLGMLFLAYFGGFLWWRGATPVAMIFSLKVVRVDGRPIDFPCAIVRSLMAAVGGMLCGIGFIWCAFDPERLAWHDKLAGTAVVKLPKAEPLV